MPTSASPSFKSRELNRRYLAERDALDARRGELVEVTRLGGPREFLDCGTSDADYIALARRAYVRGDLDVDQFEQELDRIMNITPPTQSQSAPWRTECPTSTA